MKPVTYIRPAIFTAAVLMMLAAFCPEAKAIPYVSNLGDRWTTAGSIGDIHGLFPGGTPYGSDTASFTTGVGHFSLDSVTLELLNDSSLAASSMLSVQLYQQVGNTEILLGTLGNPKADPRPTQWPQSSNPSAYTTFIDFSANGEIDLSAFSEYSVVVSMPSTSSVGAAMMFTTSSAYQSQGGWAMGQTTAGDPYASGEYLKIGVYATRVPDHSNTAAWFGCALMVLFGFRQCSLRKILSLKPVRF